jgi:SH3 domain protein
VTDERDRLQKENEALKESTQHLKKEMEELDAENQRLMRNEILHWFLAGSGVFFLGLLTGKLSRKKKHY